MIPQVGSPQNSFPSGPEATDVELIPDETLLELGLAPQSMKNADQEYQERSIDDLIKLDEYLRNRKEVANPAVAGWGQIRVHKVVPPNTIGG